MKIVWVQINCWWNKAVMLWVSSFLCEWELLKAAFDKDPITLYVTKTVIHICLYPHVLCEYTITYMLNTCYYAHVTIEQMSHHLNWTNTKAININIYQENTSQKWPGNACSLESLKWRWRDHTKCYNGLDTKNSHVLLRDRKNSTLFGNYFSSF